METAALAGSARVVGGAVAGGSVAAGVIGGGGGVPAPPAKLGVGTAAVPVTELGAGGADDAGEDADESVWAGATPIGGLLDSGVGLGDDDPVACRDGE